jgi:hypothetical protein
MHYKALTIKGIEKTILASLYSVDEVVFTPKLQPMASMRTTSKTFSSGQIVMPRSARVNNNATCSVDLLKFVFFTTIGSISSHNVATEFYCRKSQLLSHFGDSRELDRKASKYQRKKRKIKVDGSTHS